MTLVTIVVVAVNWAMKRQRQHERRRTTSAFATGYSDVSFSLGDGLVAITPCLEFDRKLQPMERQRSSTAQLNASRRLVGKWTAVLTWAQAAWSVAGNAATVVVSAGKCLSPSAVPALASAASGRR